MTRSLAYEDVETIERNVMGRDTGVSIETPASLPTYEEALAKLPENVLNLALAEPKLGSDGNRSETRYKLLCELFRLDDLLSHDEVLTVAWHAPASRKWSVEQSMTASP